jgi:hypothetical protein
MMVAVLRVMIAAGGGWLALTIVGGSTALFVVIAGALVIYGLGNAAGVAGGAWFKTVSSRNRQRIEALHVCAAVWSNDQAAPQRSF